MQTHGADGELVLDQHPVHIEQVAVGAEIIELGVDLDEVLAGIGDLRGGVDQAGGFGEAEEDRVGAAQEFRALGVVAVGGAEDLDEVDRGRCPAETAHPDFTGAVVVVAEVTAHVTVDPAEARNPLLVGGGIVLGAGDKRHRAGNIVGTEVV